MGSIPVDKELVRWSLSHSHRLFCFTFGIFLMTIMMFIQADTGILFAQSTPSSPTSTLDSETEALIARSEHVVFLIPFSHWDTDWHKSFDTYSQQADQNIIQAIQLAKQYPRFRYTLEQVLFVQHFWNKHPEYHADLTTLVQNGQISFAWGGITQPETSLVAPAVQVHNLQLGRDWIAQTFGADRVPHTAWQSDAFGNSAAFPIFLAQSDIPYLYIGRWQGHCDPDYQQCQPLPPAFYWTTPAASAGNAGRVLVTYLSYPTAWYDIYHLTDPGAQLAALRASIEQEFKQTDSKYLFLPVGFDFFDPHSNLLSLVDRWNATDPQTALVISDPDSAFQYLATEPLPEITTDLNPIWQAFYDTRPAAKIADKESEYYLTAADKFGLLLGTPTPAAWNMAAFNAHYDNIGGVSFNSVWENSQRPRFEQTVATAQADLADLLGRIASRVAAPVVVFNPTSWPRSEVIELTGKLPDDSNLPQPVQHIGSEGVAFRAADIPALGYRALTGGQSAPAAIEHPTSAVQNGGLVTLANGLVSVTVDADHGGTFSSLAVLNANTASELLSTFGDDVTYQDDSGDVYGASFGQERARESATPAQITILAAGPLIARVQAVFTLGDRQVTKTITLQADNPLIAVDLYLMALPETTALVETPTQLDTDLRTDDLGFGAFAHAVDPHPIVAGDVTYRRSIFYPILYWSDVSSANVGLTIITHGLQGAAGSSTRSWMLVRQVTRDKEGVTDSSIHHLRYAYLPHSGSVADAHPWLAAYDFNQPLITSWRSGDQINLQLPFDDLTPMRSVAAGLPAPELPTTFSLLSSSKNVVIADLYTQGDQTEAVAINYDPSTPAALQVGDQAVAVPESSFSMVPLPSTTSYPFK